MFICSLSFLFDLLEILLIWLESKVTDVTLNSRHLNLSIVAILLEDCESGLQVDDFVLLFGNGALLTIALCFQTFESFFVCFDILFRVAREGIDPLAP
jgi:hypothetical protein